MIPYTMECAIIIARPPPLPRPLASNYSTHITSYTSNDEYNSKLMLALLA